MNEERKRIFIITNLFTLNVIVSKQIFFIRGNIQYFIACKSIKCANDGIIARQSSLKKN